MSCRRTEREKQWKGEKKYWLKRLQPCAANRYFADLSLLVGMAYGDEGMNTLVVI